MPRSISSSVGPDTGAASGSRLVQNDDEAAHIARLTARQRDVLELLAKGLSNEQIGTALALSVATVRSHVAAILNTLDVGNRTEAAAVYVAYVAKPAQVQVVLDRPAITVLPFLALDGAPASQQLALGLSSDLLSLFARWCWFPVVQSGCSPRTERNESPAQIGKALGVRFVVSGDVRMRQDGLRIQARVEDVHTQSCLWAEHYDIATAELFTVEDLVTSEIVATVYSMLTARADLLQGRLAESAFEPWLLAHEGMILRERREATSNAEASARFQRALAQQPDLVLAHFGLGLVSYDQVLNQFGSRSGALDRLAACAERCMLLAPHAAEGYYLRSRYLHARGEHSLAVRVLETAIGHNPSFSAAHALLAQVLVLTNQLDAGLERMRHAVRLGPRSFVSGLAVVHFVRREYPQALNAAEKAVSLSASYPFARGMAAACAFWLGRADVAQAHFRELLRIAPAFAPQAFQLSFGPDIESVARLTAALEALRDGKTSPESGPAS